MKRNRESSLTSREASRKEIKAILELDNTTRAELKKESFEYSVLETQVKDISWRVKSRSRFGYAMLFLLFLQNIAVYGLVIAAYVRGDLKDLEIIFGILIPATLVETAFSIKVIIEWLFRDIDYSKGA